MRLLTGADIIDFHNTRYDLLVIDSNGEYAHIDYDHVASSSYEDNRATAYDHVTTHDDEQVQVLLERSTIDEGEWFPDALDENGDLTPSVADEMADIVNNDAELHTRLQIHEIREATATWEAGAREANRLAEERARRIAAFVQHCGGSQSRAALLLGLNQSTVNKLVRKVAA